MVVWCGEGAGMVWGRWFNTMMAWVDVYGIILTNDVFKISI
jgi:hypothetical protein